jgi:hypothetical protein
MVLWDISIWPQMTPQTPMASWQKPQVNDGPDSGLSSIATGWTSPPETFRMTLGVASGAWTTAAQSMTPARTTTHAIADGTALRTLAFTRLRNQDGRAHVDVLYPPETWQSAEIRPEIRTVAVTVAGDELVARLVRSGGLPRGEYGDIVRFEAPMERIAELRFQTRAYEPAIFDNISLRAGAKTDVKVIVPAVQ